MQIDIRITSTDYELGMDLIKKRRFPGKRPVDTPGNAVIGPQSLLADESNPESEIIELGVEISEDTSVGEFASWLYGKLKEREEQISFLSIGGVEVSIDEAEILRAIEDAIKK